MVIKESMLSLINLIFKCKFKVSIPSFTQVSVNLWVEVKGLRLYKHIPG